MIRIFLEDLPPSVNSMYRNVRGRGRVKTAQYIKWHTWACWYLRKEGVKPITSSQYGLIIRICPRANADITNYIKPLEDLLVSQSLTPDDKNNIFTIVHRSQEKGVEIIILEKQEVSAAMSILESF